MAEAKTCFFVEIGSPCTWLSVRPWLGSADSFGEEYSVRSHTKDARFESLVLFLIMFILLPFISCGTFPLFISLMKLNYLLVEISLFPLT